MRPGLPRWLEDYRVLDAAHEPAPFDSLRYHRLSDSAWLQLGGEVRYRADAVDEPVFGLRGIQDDSFLMQRLQAHADLHLLDGRLRTFVQLENTRTWGKDLLSPTDESRNDVHQAFIDARFDFSPASLTARVGRQEMAYGAQAWVTYRDVPNIRLAFDGLRLSLSGQQGAKLDAFAVRPVRADGDDFDDGSNNNVKFYGLYATLPLDKVWNIDLYAFGLETQTRRLAGLSGAEDRYTLGTRIFGKQGPYDWSWDLAGQFGDMAGASIRAWGLSTDTGYSLEGSWRPRLGVRVDMASGDRNADDNRVETFDPLFPRNGVYGEAVLTTLSNVIIVGPVLAFSPWQDVRIEPGVFKVWKQSPDDAVYLPNMVVAADPAQSSGRDIGTIFRANVRWLASSNLTIDVDYKYYDVGKAIRSVDGKDSQFISLRSTFRF
ncbi:alginate export family protein [Pseudomonas sp. I2]|uniref:alginate export family protein n=1 Tax=Pseudomonas sp. I2 TaxID=1338438 RepID=UPI0034D74934